MSFKPWYYRSNSWATPLYLGCPWISSGMYIIAVWITFNLTERSLSTKLSCHIWSVYTDHWISSWLFWISSWFFRFCPFLKLNWSKSCMWAFHWESLCTTAYHQRVCLPPVGHASLQQMGLFVLPMYVLSRSVEVMLLFSFCCITCLFVSFCTSVFYWRHLSWKCLAKCVEV